MGLRARSATKGREVVILSKNKIPETVSRTDKAIDYPSSSPASKAGIGIGIGRCNEFQSVRLDVYVEVPCHPGHEAKAGEYCVDRCSELLKANEDDLEALLRSLI